VIITKTPFRMSYVGGGSDISSFYSAEPGAVLSTAIDKFMFVTLHGRFFPGIRVAYSKTEEVERIEQVQHPLVREALIMSKIMEGVEITSTADIPSQGSGLGSSSSYTVGLLAALNAYKGDKLTAAEIAAAACYIEIERCGEPIGKQDQYAAAIGGMNLLEFMPDETVIVKPVEYTPAFKKTLDESTLVFFTGTTRSASSILAEQKENSSDKNKQLILRRMAGIAYEFKYGIENSNLLALGELLKENWDLKKSLASGISNHRIDEMYNLGISNGALGGKLLGAGAGGFMMFMAEKENHAAIRKALSPFKEVNFKIEKSGVKVIYNDR
jgi:D-glycero-alpha-D-manno-heptose-7-phosphate kinase